MGFFRVRFRVYSGRFFVRLLYGCEMSRTPVYEREVKSLIDNDVQSAISYSQSEAIEGKVSEWRDRKTVGLTMRITPGKAVWYVRRREITLRLGPAAEIDLDKARYFAEQTKLAAKRKRNLREFVETLVKLDAARGYADRMGNVEWADALADETSLLAYRKRSGDTGITWTWKALTNKFLEYQNPKLKAKYRQQYEHYLRLPEFSRIDGMLVSEVRLRDLEMLRDNIHLNHAPSAVHRALTQSKRMLSWAWKYHATAAGLEETQAEWWTRWSFEYKTNTRTHAPTIEEIARTIVIAEEFRHLADGEHETYPGTIGALWGIALTAQRTGGFLQLRPDRLFDPPKTERKLKGWKVANWTEDEMKGGRDGGRPHSLPLPPEALEVLYRHHAESGGKSEWMFTARDPKKHITQAALNLLMYRLQGRVYDHTVKQAPARKGKPGPKPKPKKERPNLFEIYGIEPWTLHDARRTMTTFLDDKRLGGAATAILGHKTDHDRVDERERMASVTDQHYNRSQRIGLKAEGMALWVKALLAAYQKERRKFRDLRPASLAA
jgi:integrase